MPPTDKDKIPTRYDIDEMLREITGKNSAQDAADRLKKYCPALYAHGWHKIEFSYSGSGDSCDELAGKISNKEEDVPFDKFTTTFPDFTIKDVEKALLDLLPIGFENNEGGCGKIKINTKTGKITLEHDEYFVDVRTTKTVF